MWFTWFLQQTVIISLNSINWLVFISAFANRRKATISLVISVRPFDRMKQLGSQWTDFDEIWCLTVFRKSVEKTEVSLKPDKNKCVLYMITYVHLWQYLAVFFIEWEMFQVKVVEKIKTHILYSVTFSLKSCRLWDNVEKCGREGDATDDNTAHALCMLDN